MVGLLAAYIVPQCLYTIYHSSRFADIKHYTYLYD